MRSNALMIAFLLFCRGCIMWDAGYTSNKPIDKYAMSASEKIPISYSVSLDLARTDIIAAPDVKELTQKIESALRETDLFSEISYGKKDGKDSYHIEFTFRQAGMSVADSMAVGLLAGYSLLLIPTCELLTFDGTAVLTLQGTPIYSTAKPEELRCLIWLPMAPFGVFMNAWTVWHYAEKGTVNALVNDIADFHKRRFLKDVDVKVIKE